MLRTMPRHALSVAACRSFAMVATFGVAGVALWLSACGHRVVQTQPTPNLVSVRGTVVDSLTRTPLSGARITFRAADSAAVTVAGATTDANGTFAISLSSGTWLMEVEHARFDSLRVSLPPRRVEVPRQAVFAFAVGTPIGGVEIYTTPGQVPAEFARFSVAPCAAIVFWTRERLGLPSAKPMQR